MGPPPEGSELPPLLHARTFGEDSPQQAGGGGCSPDVQSTGPSILDSRPPGRADVSGFEPPLLRYFV